MTEMHFPWLELAIVIPLLGALLCLWQGNGRAYAIASGTAALTLLAALAAWEDFLTLHTFAAHDHWYFAQNWLGDDVLVIDELSAPLLSLTALMYLITILTTVKAKAGRYSFRATLVSLSILMATLSSRESWLLVALLGAGLVPIDYELRKRGQSTRVFRIHMALFLLPLCIGWGLVRWRGPSDLATTLLTLAVLVRCGVAPLHCWMTDLFERCTFGTAILFCTPMIGAYAAMHFVFPFAHAESLRLIAIASMVTAVYAAAMTIVQREARRFFCYLFLSQSSLVLVGFEVSTPQGLAGALSMWLAAGLSLTGLGLVLRAIEARIGRVPLDRCHGLYAHVPALAIFFLIAGLATVGFPGTFGFFASELLISGTVNVYPQVGLIVVLATALCGIAILQAYIKVFAGTRKQTSISIRGQWSERVATFAMASLIIGGGVFPQLGIASRFHAAEHLFEERDRARSAWTTPAGPPPLGQPPPAA